MTSVCTMLGLVPMSLGIGEGSELQVPLARVVIGGLLTSTLITLVFVPAMYTLFEEGWRGMFRRGRRRPQPRTDVRTDAGNRTESCEGTAEGRSRSRLTFRRLVDLVPSLRPSPRATPARCPSPDRSSRGDLRQRLEHERRSRNRGCGTRSPGSSITASPYRIRSRSSVRGAPTSGRSRPRSARSPAARPAARAPSRRRHADDGAVQEARLRAPHRPDRSRATTRRGGRQMELRAAATAKRDARRDRRGCCQGRWRPGAWSPDTPDPLATRSSDGHDFAAALVDGERRADDVGAAFGRLLEQALVLEHLAEDDLQHALVARVGDGLDLSRHFSTNCVVGAAHRRRPSDFHRRPCARRARPARPDRRDRRAEVEQRMLQPRDVGLLAADDVLIGVVDVVVGDEPRDGLVAHQQREPSR